VTTPIIIQVINDDLTAQQLIKFGVRLHLNFTEQEESSSVRLDEHSIYPKTGFFDLNGIKRKLSRLLGSVGRRSNSRRSNRSVGFC
jgi:hypothetical protein